MPNHKSAEWRTRSIAEGDAKVDDKPDYEELREFVPRSGPDRALAADPRISVMDWILGIGNMVVRRFRGVPTAPMTRLHAKR